MRGGSSGGEADAEVGESESKAGKAAGMARGSGGGGGGASSDEAAPRKTAPADPREASAAGLRSLYRAIGWDRTNISNASNPWKKKIEQDLPVGAPLGALPGVTYDDDGLVVGIRLNNRKADKRSLKGDIGEVRWPPHLQRLELSGNFLLKGDLSKVQFPASLQYLSLKDCSSITGDLSKVQLPASLKILDLYECRSITGDLSKVQWPEGLHSIILGLTEVSGDFSEIQFPASLKTLNVMRCKKLTGKSPLQLPAY